VPPWRLFCIYGHKKETPYEVYHLWYRIHGRYFLKFELGLYSNVAIHTSWKSYCDPQSSDVCFQHGSRGIVARGLSQRDLLILRTVAMQQRRCYGLLSCRESANCTVAMLTYRDISVASWSHQSCCDAGSHLGVTLVARGNEHVTTRSANFEFINPCWRPVTYIFWKTNRPARSPSLRLSLYYRHLDYLNCEVLKTAPAPATSSSSINLLLRGEWTMHSLACGTNTLPKPLHGWMWGSSVHAEMRKCILSLFQIYYSLNITPVSLCLIVLYYSFIKCYTVYISSSGLSCYPSTFTNICRTLYIMNVDTGWWPACVFFESNIPKDPIA